MFEEDDPPLDGLALGSAAPPKVPAPPVDEPLEPE